MSQGQNVTVDVLIGSKCHRGRSELGRFVQASGLPASAPLSLEGEALEYLLALSNLDRIPCDLPVTVFQIK
jgi:hypothetical protein